MSRCLTCDEQLLTQRGLARFVVASLGTNPGAELVRATVEVTLRELRGFCSSACESSKDQAACREQMTTLMGAARGVA
jgi:hypothetical protein